ncbi:MAG: rane carboxypeptidase (penicillin-binding protein) [Ilumatobacteraceae bacterium]|nr:rane carboxypeptidase (penicillin-binding protein) [Ilumatobacteraceae bacterium]
MLYLSRLLRFSLVMILIVAVLTASVAIIGPQVVELVSAHRSDHERLSLKPLAERSYIYDSAGNLQGTLINAGGNRVAVDLEDVPETVVGSVLAAEDQSFYTHKGVNIRSIGRAVDANLQSGEASQGGSTITQQVVKNSLVGSEQDLSRKIREAFLSVELEKQMNERYCPKPIKADCRKGKDKILERYLNSVYFGGGAYGVQAASEYYFNKDVGELNWSEGALLAALIRSPSYYDPFKNHDVALKRRDIVFKRLLATKRLSKDEIGLYSQVPLPTVPNVPLPPNDYFVEEVKQQLLDDPRFGLGATPAARNRTVFESGIRVFTTFNPEMQLKAMQARNETLPNNQGDGTFPVTNPKNGEQTFGTEAIASIEPSTGAVRAMVGGPNGGFKTYQYNLATHLPGRQPGSSMKTFVLATLFENGFVPSDTVSGGSCNFDVPGQAESYSVSGKGGTNSITRQTQASNNCAFLRLGQVVGTDKVVEMALRLGVRSDLQPVVSLPLGVYDITPIDMASAYATFANDGMRNEPYYVERIEDRNGKVLYQHQLNPVRVISPQTARLVNQVLESNVVGGTGKNAQIDGGQAAAGKTGTTNDSADVWFVGYTPQLSTAIWMGAPVDRISLAQAGLGGATGGRYPATTWGRYYSLLMAGQPTVGFIPPEGTRRGKSVGKVPNEIGGSRSSGSSRRSNGGGNRTNGGGNGGTNGGGNNGGGGGGTPAPTAPVTVAPQPGFGQDD